MELSFSSVAAGIIFGSFGIYAIKRGKNRSHVLDILVGITLLVYPYFVTNVWLNWGLGVGLLTVVYRFRK